MITLAVPAAPQVATFWASACFTRRSTVVFPLFWSWWLASITAATGS